MFGCELRARRHVDEIVHEQIGNGDSVDERLLVVATHPVGHLAAPRPAPDGKEVLRMRRPLEERGRRDPVCELRGRRTELPPIRTSVAVGQHHLEVVADAERGVGRDDRVGRGLRASTNWRSGSTTSSSVRRTSSTT